MALYTAKYKDSTEEFDDLKSMFNFIAGKAKQSKEFPVSILENGKEISKGSMVPFFIMSNYAKVK